MGTGIGYVYKYMIEYKAGVPIPVICCTAVIVGIIIGMLYKTNSSVMQFIRNTSWCLLIGYVFLVLCATVIFRQDSGEMRYSLQPLWCHSTIYYKYMAGMVLNILMFMPIGFLCGVAIRNINAFKIIGVGCVLSMSVETTQLLTRRGVCNIDDVIHNTLGCIIGYGIVKLFKKSIKKREIIRP
jgi:glycopeptide antibiotics resistance protein